MRVLHFTQNSATFPPLHYYYDGRALFAGDVGPANESSSQALLLPAQDLRVTVVRVRVAGESERKDTMGVAADIACEMQGERKRNRLGCGRISRKGPCCNSIAVAENSRLRMRSPERM